MSFQMQATVDICFKIKSFRNLRDSYLRSMYFKLSVNVGNNLGVPYQIISEKQNLSSITLLDYISPKVSFGPFAKLELNELVLFRLNVPLNQIEENKLTYKFILVQSSSLSNQKVVGEFEGEHTSLLWINSFTPSYFNDNGCSIDTTVQTQLLKFRIKELKQCPKYLLTSAIELVLVSFNRLKNRFSKKKRIEQQNIFEGQLMVEVEQFIKKPHHSIFQPGSKTSQRQKLLFLSQKLIPQLGDSIQKGWSQYLRAQLIDLRIEEQREAYLKAFSLKIKEIGSQTQKIKPQNNPIIIQNIIHNQPFPIITLVSKEQAEQKLDLKTTYHFVILVHGYGANSSVMVEFELLLRYFFPHLIVINSRVNQHKTEDEIINMGKRLASQVQMALNSQVCGDDYSISFITHSLGGLIARSALTFMQQQRYHMKGFISLGTPHLGHLYHNSSLNKFGMKAMNIFKKSVVMSALLFQNQEADYRKSYIYELSSMSGLNWFQEVIFYSSKEDKFVSAESSLCLNNKNKMTDKDSITTEGRVWQEMRVNIESQLRGISYSKYLIDFAEHNKNVKQFNITDDWFGRRDHINLCVSQTFVKSVLATHKNIFK